MSTQVLVSIVFITLVCTINAKTYKVNTANDLRAAFKTVNPGDSIVLNKGTYNSSGGSSFVINRNGNTTNPILMYSTSSQTMLTAGNINVGKALFLSNADYWIIRSMLILLF
jgi:hypothetical protein